MLKKFLKVLAVGLIAGIVSGVMVYEWASEQVTAQLEEGTNGE